MSIMKTEQTRSNLEMAQLGQTWKIFVIYLFTKYCAEESQTIITASLPLPGTSLNGPIGPDLEFVIC